MKTTVLIIAVLFISSGHAEAQFKLKLSDSKGRLNDSAGAVSGLSGKSKKSGAPAFLIAGIALFFINPEVVIENKKVYFGLTKEVSAGFFPYGRIAFEYSYIFRSFDRNHLRISYNLDYIFESRDFIAFWLSGGVGYFTDTKNNGIFPQLSIAALIPVSMGGFGAVYPYFKARQTFVKGQENSNITDFSFGMGLLLYY